MAVIPLRSLPLGFRFHPTDEELVNHYLKSKINGRNSDIEVIPEVDVCKCEPWDLPDKSVIRSDDPEWFFFAPRDRKYPNGHRSNRATEAGYWKATGKDRTIKSQGVPGRPLIGMKKTLVFYRGRAPKGERTNWIMHEYRTTENEPDGASGDQGAYVLCRLFKKSPEEKSPNADRDELEGSGFSPTPTRSSPGETQNASDAVEEVENPSNQEISKPDRSEDPLPLPNIVEKQPDGIERRLADKADCERTTPLKQEENHCNVSISSKIGDNDFEVVAEVDPLLDALAQFDEPQLESIDPGGFPQMDSPYLQYMDRPYLDDYDQGLQVELFECYNSEQDFSELLETVFSNQDDYFYGGSYGQKDPAANVGKYKLQADFGKDSGSSSDVDMEVDLLQLQAHTGVDIEASEWFHRQPLSSPLARDSSLLDNISGNSASEPLFDRLYRGENTKPLHQGFGPDVFSVDSGTESLQDLFDSLEESSSQKSLVKSINCLNDTGIKIRPREPLLPEQSQLSDQGTAVRRIRLQRKLSVRSVCSTNSPGLEGSMTSQSSSGVGDHEVTSGIMQTEKPAQQHVGKLENAEPVHIDKHENSDHDEKTLSDSHEESKPGVRLRKPKKEMSSELGGQALKAMPPKFGSTPGYMAYLIIAFCMMFMVGVGFTWWLVKF